MGNCHPEKTNVDQVEVNYSLDLDRFETKCNVNDVDFYLINIQYNIINIDCTRG